MDTAANNYTQVNYSPLFMPFNVESQIIRRLFSDVVHRNYLNAVAK